MVTFPIRAGYVRKREKTRKKLLEAAKRVMAEKGAESTAIAEIAAAADVAAGTFYNYFRTREEILDAVSASLVEEFRAVMTAIQKRVDDPAERIAVAIASEVAELVLRGLGVSLEEAAEVARRPIPSLRTEAPRVQAAS